MNEVSSITYDYLLELDNTFGWGVFDNSEELVMAFGLVELSCGNGGVVVVLDDIFGWGVLDSNDDELIVLEEVTGSWVVFEIMVFWFVALDGIFGWGVLVNIIGLIWVGMFGDFPNTIGTLTSAISNPEKSNVNNAKINNGFWAEDNPFWFVIVLDRMSKIIFISYVYKVSFIVF